MKEIPTSDFNFLAPTKKLRLYFLLEGIKSNKQISQRKLAEEAGISPSVGNRYLNEFEKKEFIEKQPINERDYEYRLTEKGDRRRKKLMVEYLRETFQLFSNGKNELTSVLEEYKEDYDLEEILLYSAGEVTELLLHAIENVDLKLLSVVDDSKEKQGNKMFGYPIVARSKIPELNPDGIIVTTFQHRGDIFEKLDEFKEKDIAIIGF